MSTSASLLLSEGASSSGHSPGHGYSCPRGSGPRLPAHLLVSCTWRLPLLSVTSRKGKPRTSTVSTAWKVGTLKGTESVHQSGSLSPYGAVTRGASREGPSTWLCCKDAVECGTGVSHESSGLLLLHVTRLPPSLALATWSGALSWAEPGARGSWLCEKTGAHSMGIACSWIPSWSVGLSEPGTAPVRGRSQSTGPRQCVGGCARDANHDGRRYGMHRPALPPPEPQQPLQACSLGNKRKGPAGRGGRAGTARKAKSKASRWP